MNFQHAYQLEGLRAVEVDTLKRQVAERDRTIAELRANNVNLNNMIHAMGQSGVRTMKQLRQRAEAAEAKLDAVMLEYCPDEMTEEQRERWARNQVPAQIIAKEET